MKTSNEAMPDQSTARSPSRMLVLGVEEEGQDAKGDGGDGQVEPEDVAPRGALGQGAANDRAQAAGGGPNGLQQGEVEGAGADAEEVSDDGVDDLDQTPSCGTLEGAPRDEGRHGRRQRAGGREAGVQRNGGQQYGLAAPDVGQLGPDRGGDGVGQEVGGPDPGVARVRAEVIADGRDGSGHDGLVERGEEYGRLCVGGWHLAPWSMARPLFDLMCYGVRTHRPIMMASIRNELRAVSVRRSTIDMRSSSGLGREA